MKKKFPILTLLLGCIALGAAENIITDAGFNTIGKPGAFWTVRGKNPAAAAVKDGVLVIAQDAKNNFSLDSQNLKLQDPAAAVKISVELDSDTTHYGWRNMIVLAGKYQDNSSIDWADNSIIIPKKSNGFRTYERIFVPAKPIKEVYIRIMAESLGTLKIRNFSIRKANAEDLLNRLDLIGDPHFATLGQGKNAGWVVYTNGATPPRVENGTVILQASGKEYIAMDSPMIAMKGSTAPLKLVLDADCQGKPANWRYAALLDVVYTDGSKALWNKTMVNFPKNTDGFKKMERVFTPEKPVKRLNVKIIICAETKVKIRNIRLIPQVAAAQK